MANDLVLLENQLKPLAPRFAQVLGNTMPVERLMRTVMISVERLPLLLECDRQSIFNAAMSAACLGLEVDGVTGQAFLIPFKGKAQLVIGYKGFNTLAARSGITVTGGVVREGDKFEYELGSSAFVRHVPVLGNKGRIIGAWAVGAAHGRPPIPSVLSIDDLMGVKARSPGAKRSDSPWNDQVIGFPAMSEKTAKRRLARSMPLNVMQLAARLDEAFEEQGQAAWISPDKGVVLEGEVIAPRHSTITPLAEDLISPPSAPAANAVGSAPHSGPEAEPTAPIPTAAEYFTSWNTIILGATNADLLAKTWSDQIDLRKQIAWTDEHDWRALQTRVKKAVDSMRAPA
jgi:recombination protein RecT